MLEYGLSSENGFLLLTGDVGTGKTTLINALIKNLQDDVLVANVTNPNLELMDFFHLIAQSLGIQKRFYRKLDFLLYFQSFLQETSLEQKRVLLIIDEAHKLSQELLEEIRLLSNVERPEKNLINIFFVGQNEINQTLKSSECRSLRQRITLNYNIKPLSEAETSQYINHRLKIAGTEERIFEVNTIREIHRFSGDYPRLINVLCDRALLIGYVRTLEKITPDIILECAQGLLLPDETNEDLCFSSSKPSIADGPAHAVERLLTKQENNAFKETNTSDIPLTTSQKLDGATPLENKNNDKPAEGYVRTYKSKMIYGSITSFLIIIIAIIVFLSNNSSSESNRHQSVPQGLHTIAPMKSDKPLSSSSINTSGLSVADSSTETDNAKDAIEPPFVSNAEAYHAATSEMNTFSSKKEEKAIPSPEMNAVEQKLAPSSIEKAANIQDHDESEASKPLLFAKAHEAVSSNNFNRAVELPEENRGQQEELKQLYVQALLGEAGRVLKEDTDQAAEELLIKAAKIDPQNAGVYYNLGKLHTYTKEYSKAIEAYSMAVNLNPDSAGSFFNLGFNSAAIKNYSQAEKMFLRAIELEPPYLDEAFFNLAIVQYKQGKKQQCVENLEKAIYVNPDNQRAHKYLNRFKRQKLNNYPD